jgi:hypothetical protein
MSNHCLLQKILHSKVIADTRARNKTTASNGRLRQDLIRLAPEEPGNPANKLEEWRTIAILASQIGHSDSSQLTFGHLLKPGKRTERFLDLLQKASPPRAATLIAQEAKNLKKEGPINLYWTCLSLLNWQTRKKEEWTKIAKAFYLTEGENT